MKVKIIKVDRSPKGDELDIQAPTVTVELPSGERFDVTLYDHSDDSISPQRARKKVLQEIGWEIQRHQNRTALCDAAEALGVECDVDMDDIES